MNKLAFFDFDNTIYDGYTYHDFINHISSRLPEGTDYLKELLYIREHSNNYNTMVKNMAELIGKSITRLSQQEFEKHCRLSCTKTKLLDWVFPVLEFLKQNGFSIIIVSAAFGEMLLDSLEVLQVDDVLCSKFFLSNDIYTGEVSILMNGDQKADSIESMLIHKDDTFSIAFGDSMGDVPMLNAVNQGFLVRSDNAEVRDLAIKKGWYMGNDSQSIINKVQEYIF